MGGRGDIREGYFTREERAILERALKEGELVVPPLAERSADTCPDLHTLESLFQRGYLRRKPERGDISKAQIAYVFSASSSVESALKRASASAGRSS
jgi:hypothetical protein